MSDPLTIYKSYHTNHINIRIHQVCIPLLLVSAYSIFPIYVSFSINVFYSITYLLFDVFSKKSVHSVYYLQTIFLLHFLFRHGFSLSSNLVIHIVSWILQIAGHAQFEKNRPAFLVNLYDSFLFAPYFTFLETCYPSSFIEREKYTILAPNHDPAKKSILYFAGLFQKAQHEYRAISEELSQYNPVYINTICADRETIAQILQEVDSFDIECLVGFSFGGALCLQLKAMYLEQKNQELRTILISPAGVQTNTVLETAIRAFSGYLYRLYGNEKWRTIHQYPTYQNTHSLCNTDILIGSSSDMIHPIQIHDPRIVFHHAAHLDMISVVQNQKIVSQLLCHSYRVEEVATKPLTSVWNKLFFGGHFYPYHITLWTSISIYQFRAFLLAKYPYRDLLYGFLFASVVWSFTEYMFHRCLLHGFLYAHHKKHHVFPNKLSIIHTPMSMVILNWIAYYYLLTNCVSPPIMNAYAIFFPINYLSFEFTHLLSHSYKGSNPIVVNAKHYHKLHHIDDKVNFSFVTPFWDYVFGTLSPQYSVSKIELLFGVVPFYSYFMHKNSIH